MFITISLRIFSGVRPTTVLSAARPRIGLPAMLVLASASDTSVLPVLGAVQMT
jgi:hypothetical protein